MSDVITPEDLILLAENGLGWHQDRDKLAWFDADGKFQMYSDRDVQVMNAAGIVEFWNPGENLRHAGMLMRAMGIEPFVAMTSATDESIKTWGARRLSSDLYNGFGEGNTEPAICEAVCQCALKVLKARKEALSTKT